MNCTNHLYCAYVCSISMYKLCNNVYNMEKIHEQPTAAIPHTRLSKWVFLFELCHKYWGTSGVAYLGPIPKQCVPLRVGGQCRTMPFLLHFPFISRGHQLLFQHSAHYVVLPLQWSRSIHLSVCPCSYSFQSFRSATLPLDQQLLGRFVSNKKMLGGFILCMYVLL